MATIVLRPDAVLKLNDWKVGTPVVNPAPGTPPETTAKENLRDDVDSSDVYHDVSTTTSYLEVAFDNLPVLPAGAQIRHLVPRIRAKGNQAASRINWQLWNHVFGVVLPIDTYSFGGAYVTVAGAAHTREYSGYAWSEAIVANTGLLVHRRSGETAVLNVTALYIDVITNERPVVTATGPVDEDAGVAGNQVTSTSTPAVTWTYTDPENDAQERYVVKVFSAAEYGIAGFNPDTAPATWDSGVVYSSATSATVGVILTNGATYRAYVKASDVGSEGRSSLWSFREFTMAVPAPPVPVLANPVADLANQEVDLSATSTGTPAPEFLRFEWRPASSSAVWYPVRGGERVPVSSGVAGVVSDRETPPNQSGIYRVSAGRTVSGQDILSAPSASKSSPAMTNTKWRLKDLTLGTALVLRVSDGEADLVESEPHGIFEPLGAGRRVVISDTLKGESIGLSLTFLAGWEWDEFRAMRANANTLLLVSPMYRQWYVRFVGDLSSTLLNFGGPTGERRRVSVDFVEVDRP